MASVCALKGFVRVHVSPPATPFRRGVGVRGTLLLYFLVARCSKQRRADEAVPFIRRPLFGSPQSQPAVSISLTVCLLSPGSYTQIVIITFSMLFGARVPISMQCSCAILAEVM
jgi:hypothetical protein